MATKKKIPAKKNTAKGLAKTDLDWFVEARFGLFIHWGLYALPARHEWVKNQERITTEDYEQYFEHFAPDLYDPVAWAKAAKQAGMKYFVITTKHHEGFCLWDTKQTNYRATKTPHGKDLIKPMVEAFRAEGLKVGFYYSLIDWHHPEFPVDQHHPQRDDKAFRKQTQGRDVRKYAAYMQKQMRELLTKYGKVDYLFFDFSYPGKDGKGHADWDAEKLMKLCRKLQPGIVINDRLDIMDHPRGWDVTTPEQLRVREPVMRDGKPAVWETCQTFSGSWGYHRDESTWRSVRELLVELIHTVSKCGNLLMNVGPTARGLFDDRALDRLSGMGAWLKLHGRAIYGCTQAPAEFKTPDNCLLTYNPKTRRIYVHILDWPYKEICLEGFGGKVAYAQLLDDASELRPGGIEDWQKNWINEADNTLTLGLPIVAPEVTIPVIELFLK
jgi:alpha-L-fucosidase